MRDRPHIPRIFGVELPERAGTEEGHLGVLTTAEVAMVIERVSCLQITEQELADIREGPNLFAYWSIGMRPRPHDIIARWAFRWLDGHRCIQATPHADPPRRIEYILDEAAEERRLGAMRDLIGRLAFETGIMRGRLCCELKQCLHRLDDLAFDEAIEPLLRIRSASQLRGVLREVYPGRPQVLVRNEDDWERFGRQAATGMDQRDDD